VIFMRKVSWIFLLGLALFPGPSRAAGLAVELWTDRGNDAVYKPGDRMVVSVRSSTDAHVLVYEIDAEGAVNVLFPDAGGAGFVQAKQTYEMPPKDADVELVVREPVGQCYIVAIASLAPFENLPWYLRPFNPQAEEVGYVGQPEDEEGVTAEGKVVGDPFVAIERIRRRVLGDPQDGESFSTAYTSYFVHEAVRYPRYLCYDCHRPGHWAWWDDFDPYYAHCSVFDLRVNWSWHWGPRYWYGSVPYFAFVYRPTCPPRYHAYYQQGGWCSSWDGWSTWCNLWGVGTLTRFKSAPPSGYVSPSKFGIGPRAPGSKPPGFLADFVRRGRTASPLLPGGRGTQVRDEGGSSPRQQRPVPGAGPSRQEQPAPASRSPRQESAPEVAPRSSERPAPATRAPRQETPQAAPRESDRPVPGAPRQEAPPQAKPRDGDRPRPGARSPRQESSSRYSPRSGERPAPAARYSRQDASPPPAQRAPDYPTPAASTARYDPPAPTYVAPPPAPPRGSAHTAPPPPPPQSSGNAGSRGSIGNAGPPQGNGGSAGGRSQVSGSANGGRTPRGGR
jgi:hypothetical protein